MYLISSLAEKCHSAWKTGQDRPILLRLIRKQVFNRLKMRLMCRSAPARFIQPRMSVKGRPAGSLPENAFRKLTRYRIGFLFFPH